MPATLSEGGFGSAKYLVAAISMGQQDTLIWKLAPGVANHVDVELNIRQGFETFKPLEHVSYKRVVQFRTLCRAEHRLQVCLYIPRHWSFSEKHDDGEHMVIVKSNCMKKNTLVTFSAAALLMLGLVSLPSAGAQKGDATKGKEVFEQCSVCHNADSDEKKMGPALKGLFKREKLSNGKKLNEESVRGLINAGGNGMPAYEELLSAEERDNLVAYLKTL